jgi:arginase
MYLCLNSEWQGCESPELERGARLLAQQLFAHRPFLDIGPAVCADLSSRNGVFALDCVANRVGLVLERLRAASPERILTVGGTCGAEAAPVAYLNQRYSQLGLVWLDAHADLNTPDSSPSSHFHGMVLRALMGEGATEIARHISSPLDPRQVVIAGVRDLDAAEREFISSAGVGLVEQWPDDVSERVSSFLKASGVERLYVHLDVDVFDPAAYGDALFSVPGGPAPAAVGATIRDLVIAFDIVGVGLVESCARKPGAAAILEGVLVDGGLWPPV